MSARYVSFDEPDPAFDQDIPVSKEEEKEELKQTLKELEDDIKSIRSRLKELD